MKPLNLVLFCVGCFYNAQATSSKNLQIPQRDLKWKDWRDALNENPKYKPYTPNETIGEGVLLRAVALYDSNFYENVKINEVEKHRRHANTGGTGNPVGQYFQTFFQEVQAYFNERFIMINITVESVTQMDNLTAYFEGPRRVIDGRKTLENITKYGDGQPKTNDTIFYLFTWPRKEGNSRRLFDEVNTAPPHRSGVSEVATNGTFCSNLTSAAFVRHKYKNYNIWSTVKATLTTFGSLHFIVFTEKDYQKMNETFIRCSRHSIPQFSGQKPNKPWPLEHRGGALFVL
uniref:Putative conserved secreted protein salivary gland overexpressed n=1 Tax=Rhipicephalus microplus TaxID=6941 RepID=A0A6M2D4J5_RHIMP